MTDMRLCYFLEPGAVRCSEGWLHRHNEGLLYWDICHIAVLVSRQHFYLAGTSIFQVCLHVESVRAAANMIPDRFGTAGFGPQAYSTPVPCALKC
jgi:hypothetical protein